MILRRPFYQAASRSLDFALSLLGLLLIGPLLMLLALAIFFAEGRPIFFRQFRVGQHGKPFRIWKFRTMRNLASGTKITAEADQRVTSIGKILRRYKLDELPQLLNVLLGNMSFVGPRPEVPDFVRLEDPAWRSVLSVKPGITDAASLLYRDEEAILGARLDPESYYREVVLPAKLELNMKHLASRSLMRDLKLLAMTIQCSFFPTTRDAQRVRKALSLEGLISE